MAKSKVTIAARKPPKLDDARQFVREADAKTSKLPTIKKPNTTYVERRDGREYKKMTIYLPIPQAHAFKVYAAQQNREMSEIVSELLTKILPAT